MKGVTFLLFFPYRVHCSSFYLFHSIPIIVPFALVVLSCSYDHSSLRYTRFSLSRVCVHLSHCHAVAFILSRMQLFLSLCVFSQCLALSFFCSAHRHSNSCIRVFVCPPSHLLKRLFFCVPFIVNPFRCFLILFFSVSYLCLFSPSAIR